MADSDFVYEVNHSAMREYVEQVWGWDGEEQRRFHDRGFHTDGLWIIHVDSGRVGFVEYEQQDDAIWLARLALWPNSQGQGIGSQVVALIRQRATEVGLPMRLRVLEVNVRALALYERLGFVRTRTESPHIYMEAPASW